jgi:hypothetical protein
MTQWQSECWRERILQEQKILKRIAHRQRAAAAAAAAVSGASSSGSIPAAFDDTVTVTITGRNGGAGQVPASAVMRYEEMTEPIPIQGWGLPLYYTQRRNIAIPSSFLTQTPLPPSIFKHSQYDDDGQPHAAAAAVNAAAAATAAAAAAAAASGREDAHARLKSAAARTGRQGQEQGFRSSRGGAAGISRASDMPNEATNGEGAAAAASDPLSPHGRDVFIHGRSTVPHGGSAGSGERRLHPSVARRLAMREALVTAPLPLAWDTRPKPHPPSKASAPAEFSASGPLPAGAQAHDDGSGVGGGSGGAGAGGSSSSRGASSQNSWSFLLQSRSVRYHHAKKAPLPALNRATFRQYMATTQPLLTPSTVAKRFSKITVWKEEMLKRKVPLMR